MTTMMPNWKREGIAWKREVARRDSLALAQMPRPGSAIGVGLLVYSREGRRLGRIEAVELDAFRVGAASCDFWVDRGAVQRVTPGGLVFLALSMAELDSCRSDTHRQPMESNA